MIKIIKTTEVVKSVDLTADQIEEILLGWAIANGFSEKANLENFGFDGCYISERHFEQCFDGEEGDE